jgi:molecular chaperone GrpE
MAAGRRPGAGIGTGCSAWRRVACRHALSRLGIAGIRRSAGLLTTAPQRCGMAPDGPPGIPRETRCKRRASTALLPKVTGDIQGQVREARRSTNLYAMTGTSNIRSETVAPDNDGLADEGVGGVEGTQGGIDAVGCAKPVAQAQPMPESSEESTSSEPTSSEEPAPEESSLVKAQDEPSLAKLAKTPDERSLAKLAKVPDERSLATTLAELVELVRANNAQAEARERVIDWLRGEVEQLKRGEHSVLLRPVVTDLQHLRSDLLRQARTLPADIGQQQMAELLESFALSVEHALERCGTVPIRPSVGDDFSPRKHRAVKLLPASSADEDETIAEVVADGYLDTHTDRVTEPARVHVRRWAEPPPPGPPEVPEPAVDEQINEQEGTDA